MQLGEVVTAMPAIQKLMDASLSASIAFRIAKFAKEVEPHVTTYEKVRQELLEKFGTKGDEEENGQVQYSFANGTSEKFMTELTNLLEEKVNLKFKKVKVSDLEGAELTPRDMMSLEWALTDK